MSAGHHTASHPIRQEREHEIEQLLDDPKFSAAVAGYKTEDDQYDIPFLGGSNNKGDTVFFDRRFVDAVAAGKVLYEGKCYNPKPFVALHEAVEGALIRLRGLDYASAHEFATDAERIAVEHSGLDWGKYQASLRPWIKTDEAETDAKGDSNAPPDLLTVPYKGSKQDKGVEDDQMADDDDAQRQANYQRGANKVRRIHAVGFPSILQDAQNRQMENIQNAVPRRPDDSISRSPGGYVPNNRWGNQSGPMPINAEGAAYNVTHGTATGNALQPTAGGGLQYGLTGDWKSKSVKDSPGGYVPNPAQNNASNQIRQDETHPRQHALAMASATHLLKMGHIDQGTHAKIHKSATAALGKAKKPPMMAPAPMPAAPGMDQQPPAPFGSFAPR